MPSENHMIVTYLHVLTANPSSVTGDCLAERNGVHIQSFAFSTVATDLHGKLTQDFINWE